MTFFVFYCKINTINRGFKNKTKRNVKLCKKELKFMTYSEKLRKEFDEFLISKNFDLSNEEVVKKAIATENELSKTL